MGDCDLVVKDGVKVGITVGRADTLKLGVATDGDKLEVRL